MNTQKRRIIGAIAMVVVLSVGYFVGTHTQKEDQRQEEKGTLILQTDFKATKLVIETDTASATYVKEGTNWVVQGQESIDLVQLSIDQLIAYVKNLDYIKKIEDGMKTAEQFGLVKGNALTIEDAQGNEIQLVVGDRTVDGIGYYVSTKEDSHVYIVDAQAGAALKKLPDDMRDRFPEYVNYDNSQYISITKADGTAYVIEPNPDTPPAIGYGEYILQGYYANPMLLLTESLRDNIGAPLYNIYATSFIDEYGDLSVYGLDQPRLVIDALDKDGNGCTIEIGNENEQGDYYAKFSNKPFVCTVKGSNILNIEDARIFDIIGKFYVPLNINSIQSIYVVADKEEYVVVLDHAAGVVQLNGKEISSSQASEFLNYLSVLTMEGEVSEQVLLDAEIAEIIVLDVYGKKYTMEFFSYDDNYNALQYNGAIEFITGKKSLDFIINALRAIQ